MYCITQLEQGGADFCVLQCFDKKIHVFLSFDPYENFLFQTLSINPKLQSFQSSISQQPFLFFFDLILAQGVKLQQNKSQAHFFLTIFNSDTKLLPPIILLAPFTSQMIILEKRAVFQSGCLQRSLILIQLIQGQDHIMEQISQIKQVKSIISDYQMTLKLPFSLSGKILHKHQQYQRDGHWNQRQRLKYSVFLNFFHELLEDPLKKKRVRIYEMMADMIVTRDANQCRSHHQKMEKYRKTIPDIIASVAEKYEPTVFTQLSEKYLVLIKQLLQNAQKYKRIGGAQTIKKKSKKQPTLSQQDYASRYSESQKGKQVKVAEEDEEEVSEGRIGQDQEMKKRLKKTADSYQRLEVNRSQEENIPEMRFEESNRQNGQNEQQIRMMPFLEQNGQFPPPNEETPPRDIVAEANAELQLPQGFYLDQTSRLHYQQQVAALQLQKRWRVQNAANLYNQWSHQVQRIKLCDDTIKLYNQILRSSSQRAQL